MDHIGGKATMGSRELDECYYSLLDGLDADFGIFGEEDKHLVSGVVIVGYQDGKVCAVWMTLTAREKEKKLC